ncbi:AAA family ATPase [Amycolatopsis sp. NPDC051373]|uniref:phosphatase domain-containing protein n=1 Tax=Amycolatopsis sp. NPDC051373 TaxID=3155801 RepID=UPI00344BECA8
MTRGLPASGKTSWATSQIAAAEPGTLVRLNRDELRALMHGGFYGSYTTEEQVTKVQHGGVESLLRAGVSVIVDDTNLRAKYVRNFAAIAWRCGADFAVQDFTHVELRVCVARDSERDASVGREVIEGMHRKFLAGRTLPLPIPEKPVDATGAPYKADPRLPSAVMVDIDGTVALHHDVRDPYDTSRYHLDRPNRAVIEVVRALYLSGRHLVFCSGRDERFRQVTEEWLRRRIPAPFADLHMRPANDTRRDDVVKLELFDKHIRHNWNVRCVLDDRDRVVNAWRSIGLTVLQVADGDF